VVPAGVTSGLRINAVPAQKPDVQHGIDLAGPAYPLTRVLYFASISGFQGASVTPSELAIARCFADDAVMLAGGPGSSTSLIAANGFIELPDPKPGNSRTLCRDFDETQPLGITGCGAPGPNRNVCQLDMAGLGLPATEIY
jgi:hypothetical protein